MAAFNVVGKDTSGRGINSSVSLFNINISRCNPDLHSDDVACSDETLVSKYVLNSSSLLCLSNC